MKRIEARRIGEERNVDPQTVGQREVGLCRPLIAAIEDQLVDVELLSLRLTLGIDEGTRTPGQSRYRNVQSRLNSYEP